MPEVREPPVPETEGDPKHDIEILDVVTFLARQVEAKRGSDAVTVHAQESVEA